MLGRGFTLVELLAVVAIIGIMAALALVGYRRYMRSAGASEAAAVIQGIRAGQEAYKAEMLVYIGCSGDLNDYYPRGNPDEFKVHWDQSGHADWTCWRQLNVVTDGPVRFGYAVVAGMPANALPALSITPPANWPPPLLGPWYVIQAAGDRDNDDVNALFVATSFTGEIFSQDDTE
jgi:type IV pilus assembly protein PilA